MSVQEETSDLLVCVSPLLLLLLLLSLGFNLFIIPDSALQSAPTYRGRGRRHMSQDKT